MLCRNSRLWVGAWMVLLINGGPGMATSPRSKRSPLRPTEGVCLEPCGGPRGGGGGACERGTGVPCPHENVLSARTPLGP